MRTSRGLLEYAVSSVTVYRKSTLARDAGRIFSQTVPGRLVLITCEDWNGTGYDSNAVVVADPGVTGPRGCTERDQRSLSGMCAG